MFRNFRLRAAASGMSLQHYILAELVNNAADLVASRLVSRAQTRVVGCTAEY